MENPDARKWNAVYVASRSEKKVAEKLSEKGIANYLPLVKTLKQWSDRKKMVEIPLLNGYVFVHIPAGENERVLQTRGVVSFVRSEGKIAAIRDIEIERLKQLVNLGYQMEMHRISRNYKQGDKVRITSGALKGIEGFVVQAKESKLIDILLESIGQCIRVKVPIEILTSSLK